MSLRAVFNARDAHDISARAFHPCAHAVEKIGHIHHMRLFSGIDDRGFAARAHGREHDIDGCPDGYDIKENIIAG